MIIKNNNTIKCKRINKILTRNSLSRNVRHIRHIRNSNRKISRISRKKQVSRLAKILNSSKKSKNSRNMRGGFLGFGSSIKLTTNINSKLTDKINEFNKKILQYTIAKDAYSTQVKKINEGKTQVRKTNDHMKELSGKKQALIKAIKELKNVFNEIKNMNLFTK